MKATVSAAAAATAVALSLIAGAAGAQAVRTERNMSLELANQIAAATVAACAAGNYNVSVAVVDRAGVLRALQRADNAGPHTVSAAQGKAYTSASARANTTAMLENVQKNPGAQTLGDIPGFLVLGGGVPVRVGNEVIGAVGVGGAPGGHLDEQCANAGVAKVADLLK
ncbi:MAG: heme-binding protein [Burkholderiaceae bacterium]